MSSFLCLGGGGFCLKFHGHRILDTIDMILTSLGGNDFGGFTINGSVLHLFVRAVFCKNVGGEKKKKVQYVNFADANHRKIAPLV
jgi:hypothetical protein